MQDLANLANGRLENAVRARISDHERREIARVRIGPRAKIGKIDIYILQRRHGHDFQSGHGRARWIRSVRRRRDETNVAVRFVTRLVIFTDSEQTGELALRSGVWLQREGFEA